MDIEKARYNMIEQQIRPCGVHDKLLLDLLMSVKREIFIAPEYKNIAFSDVEIPLPGGQKMFCPSIDALLIQELALGKEDQVLEIGTGSGYVTAILAKLSKFVYSFELDEQNKHFAVKNLTNIAITNVSVLSGDGIYYVKDDIFFNKIFVGGALHMIPDELKHKLAIGGDMVCVTGGSSIMHAVKITRVDSKTFKEKKLFETFVDYLAEKNINKFIF